MNQHTKRCYANAMIAKIQNERDADSVSVIEFKIELQQTNMIAHAIDYMDGLMDCICEESEAEKA